MRDYKPARKKKSRSIPKSRSSRSSKKPKKTNFKLIYNLIVVGLVLVLTMVLVSLSLTYFFPLKTAQTIFLTTNSDQSEPKTYLIRLVPSKQSTTLIKLDADKPVDVLGGYGEYKLHALYPLLKIEKKDNRYIKSALSLSLETIVDDVVVAQIDSPIERREDLEMILLDTISKDFTQITHFHKLLSYYSFVKDASFDLRSISENGLSTKTKLVLQEETPETCPVAILNTTQTRGLAGKIGEIFSNSGINVIRVNSESNKVARTQIYFDETLADCVELVEQVSQVIPNPIVEVNTELAERYRAGIVVLLGEDFSE